MIGPIRKHRLLFYRDKPKSRTIVPRNCGLGVAAQSLRPLQCGESACQCQQRRGGPQGNPAILADPSLAAVHGITRELQGYIANIEDTAGGWTS